MEGIPRSRGRKSRRWVEWVRPQCRARDATTVNPDGTVGAPCWWCGQPIDYTIPDGHDDAWSPDHVHTVADHPELAEDPANIKPSHLVCNKARGRGQQTTSPLGAPSRSW